MSADAEKVIAILEKHNVALPQSALDELNAAGSGLDLSGLEPIIERGGVDPSHIVGKPVSVVGKIKDRGF